MTEAANQLAFGKSSIMRALYQRCQLIASTSYPVLLIGETGTGKTWLAKTIHDLSKVESGPFVECAIPHLDFGSLALDQLLGHCKGAFTGASERYRGRIEQATGGSLFLDEIGLASAEIQAVLLTLVDAQTVTPLGSERKIPVRVRVIAATNEPLAQRVQERTFREDLYYRLRVLPLVLPPLRKRRADIPLLARGFLAAEAAAEQLPVPVLSPEAIRRLRRARWRGNLRELRSVMIRALLTGRDRGVIDADDLQFDPDPEAPKVKGRKFPPETIQRALKSVGNNKSRAAATLGCSRKTIQRNVLLAIE